MSRRLHATPLTRTLLMARPGSLSPMTMLRFRHVRRYTLRPIKNLAAARFFYYASWTLIVTHIGPWPTA